MRDDPLLSTLQKAAGRRLPRRLLVIGGFSQDLAEGLGAEATSRLHLAAFDADSPLHAGSWDAVLWRLPAHWSQLELERLRDLPAPRGRIFLVVQSRERRRLVLELSGLGFAILEAHSVGLPTATDGVSVLVARGDEYLVRSYREGDETSILDLFAPAFHTSRSLDHWRWKFLDNPYGGRRITLATTGDGRLAAHYAGYPALFTEAHDGHLVDIPVLQIGDTMTDPAFRAHGRGPTSLLGRSVRHFYAAYCENAVGFNYGVNTGNIQRFSLRFVGAERVEEIPFRRRDGSPPATTGHYAVARRHSVDGAFDRLFRRAAPAYGALLRRDQIALRWRYLDCPDRPGFVLLAARRWRRLVAWAVFRRVGDELRWVDALTTPRHAGAAADLLAAALHLPEHAGVEEVTAWFPDRPAWWHRQVEALGLVRAPEPDDLALMTVPHQRPDAADRLRHAYYTRGDSDLA
ncbi:MAG: hypothetical protein AAGC60_22385 [Acidobacteriota bacterium]